MGYLASGFRDVDDTDDIARYSNCLNLLHTIQFFKKYKDDCHQMLHLTNGLSVLDVGCGIGDDLIDMAGAIGPRGIVTGVDLSEALLAIARQNIKKGPGNIELVKGDALNLEFGDESFDRCRIDRTLQHIAGPKKALAEMYRVLRPGGIMLAFDNDWETFMFSCTDKVLVRKVANYWCDSFASGWVGRYLFCYFRELGLAEVKVYPRTLVINELDKSDKVFDLFQTINNCVEENIITADEANELHAEMREQDRSGSFFSAYKGFIVLGRKTL